MEGGNIKMKKSVKYFEDGQRAYNFAVINNGTLLKVNCEYTYSGYMFKVEF
jgi:hypothetical protein